MIVVFIVAIWFIPSFRGVIHETDQAALLDGAWQLSHGLAPISQPDLYNYDKLFFSYWLLAAAFRLLQSVVTFDPVSVGNVISSLFFSASLLQALLRRFSSRSVGGLLFAALLAPAFILHASYLAPVFLSGGFLLWLFSALASARRRCSISLLLLVSVLTFAAVGSRADGVLVLPLMCWLTLWPLPRPWKMILERPFWAAVVGALAALIIGRLIGAKEILYAYPPVFNFEIFAAYTVFGLGAGALVLAHVSFCLGLAIARVRSWRRLSWAMGLFWLWFPFGFYVLQLFSTRYWVQGLIALTIFLCSRRGMALLACSRRRHPFTFQFASRLSLVVALIPLVIGVSLPFPIKPRLTMSQSTLFPTGDGFLPMGGYGAFLYRSPGGVYIPDHSQAIWLAAKDSLFVPNQRGNIVIFPTPMMQILFLACHIRGYGVEDQRSGSSQPSYVDLRSVVKLAGGLDTGLHLTDPGASLLQQCRLEEISPRVRGTSVLRLTPLSRPDPALNVVWSALRAVFRGNDFQIYEVRKLIAPNHRLSVPLGEGRTIAILDFQPFQLTAKGHDGVERILRSAAGPDTYGMHVLVFNGRQADLADLEVEAGLAASGQIAEAALPDYMSVRYLAH